MHELSTAQVVTTLVLIAITATRFLNAAKPFWNRLPVTVRWLPPVLVVVLPLLSEQLKLVQTPTDLVVALLVAAGMIVPNHEERVGTTPAVVLLLVIGGSLSLSGCASWKPIARTADGLAEAMCAQFFAEQKPRLTLEDAARQFCATEEELQPWIDQVLAAKDKAGKAALSRAGQ